MNFILLIKYVLNDFKKTTHELNDEYGIHLDPASLTLIENKIHKKLLQNKTMLNSIVQNEEMDETEIHDAVTRLSLAMMVKAKKDNRTEIIPDDFESSFINLKCPFWPFCSSRHMPAGMIMRNEGDEGFE